MQRSKYISLSLLVAALALTTGIARPAFAQAPAAPSFVQAYPAGGTVLITWAAVIGTSQPGYFVSRRLATEAADKAVKINAQPALSTFMIDIGPDGKGLPNGTPLIYFVTAATADSAGKLTEGPASKAVVVVPHAPILGGF